MTRDDGARPGAVPEPDGALAPGTEGPAGGASPTPAVERFAGNTAALLAANLLNTVLAAVVAVFLVRYLGREEYGLLSTTYAYFSIFLLLTTLGIDTVVHREAARRPDEVGTVVEEALGLRLLLSVAAMAASWALLPLLDPSPRVALLVFLVSLSYPFSIHSLFLVPYAVGLRMAWPKLALGVWAVLLSAVKLGMIALEAPLEAFAALEAAAGVVTLGIAALLARRTGLRPRLRWLPEAWRGLVAEALPVALALLMIQVYLRVDQLMLYRWIGPEEVGLYGASVRVVELANVIPTVFMASAFPILSRLSVGEGDRLERATRLSFRAMAWVSLPAAVWLFLHSAPLLGLLFGEAFLAAEPMLAVLAWSLPVVFLNSILYNRLFATGDPRPAALLAGIAAAANVALNLVLIPRWQGTGAAVATVVSYGLVPALALAVPVARDVARHLGPALPRTLLAAGAGWLVLGWTGAGPWSGLALLSLAFGLVMVVTGEWGREELRLVRRLAGRGP